MIIVAGPPCSGKTTFVEERALPQDPILDWDAIYTEIAGQGVRPAPVGWDRERQATELEFRRRWDSMTTGWVIRCAPHRRHRSLMRKLKGAQSIVLATPPAECIRRLMLDDTRPDKEAWITEIHRWWMEYQPSTSNQEFVIQNWILDGSEKR
jgi:hypothetical protein